jgi:5-methylcytosine-specific restriction endonuclease McrA
MLVGCDFKTLQQHLEETWRLNYGTVYNGEPIHIDHKIPLACATTEDEVLRLSLYTNLQYLKPEDNLLKSDKLDWAVPRTTNKLDDEIWAPVRKALGAEDPQPNDRRE